MKVNIGPYTSALSTYEIESAYLRFRYRMPGLSKTQDPMSDYLELDEKDFNRYDRAVIKSLDWIQKWLLDRFINPIFYNRTRKIKVRIDRYDTWSMDDTLSWVILPLLRQLRDTKHGSPYVHEVDVPEYLRVPVGFDPKLGDTDDNWHARWEWILDEMIWAFEQTTQGMDNEDIETSEEQSDYCGYRWSTVDPAVKFDTKVHEERKQYGFMLFGKYYQNLWD